ncbi:hypothetical protein D3C84_243900 [compost metagenome]
MLANELISRASSLLREIARTGNEPRSFKGGPRFTGPPSELSPTTLAGHEERRPPCQALVGASLLANEFISRASSLLREIARTGNEPRSFKGGPRFTGPPSELSPTTLAGHEERRPPCQALVGASLLANEFISRASSLLREIARTGNEPRRPGAQPQGPCRMGDALRAPRGCPCHPPGAGCPGGWRSSGRRAATGPGSSGSTPGAGSGRWPASPPRCRARPR